MIFPGVTPGSGETSGVFRFRGSVSPSLDRYFHLKLPALVRSKTPTAAAPEGCSRARSVSKCHLLRVG